MLHPKYQKISVIYSGSYGEIYLCKQLEEFTEIEDFPIHREIVYPKRDYVAIKKFKEISNTNGLDIDMMREIKFLTHLKHPNIVEILYMFIHTKENIRHLCFVMDYMVSLRDIMNLVTVEDSKYVLYQIVNGLEFLHQNSVLHRDLKPENILINRKGQVQIGDYGLSRRWRHNRMSCQVCTKHYRAPEFFFDASIYSGNVDIWSVGCIFAELLTKKILFQGNVDLNVLQNIINLLGTPNNNNWPGFEDLPMNLRFEQRDPFQLKKYFKNTDQVSIQILEGILKYTNRISIATMKDLLKSYYKPSDDFILMVNQKINEKLGQN